MNIDKVFDSQTISPETAAVVDAITAGAKQFAEVVQNLTPASADQSAALRKIREACWTAIAATLLDGKL